MSTISYSHDLEVRYDLDVVVAGGGPAGLAAAVAAAKQGAKTLLIEGHSSFGGMGTAGLVPAFMQFADGVNFMAGGVGRDVYDRMWQQGAAAPGSARDNPQKMVNIRVEALKRIYDAMISDAGADFLLMTQVIDVKTDGERITHAVCAAKSGVFAVAAKVFVDCTGDGDLAAWAGAPFEKGDDDGNMMPGTLCSIWADLDWDTIHKSKKWPQAFMPEGIEKGIFSQHDLHLPGFWRVGRNLGGGNIGHTFGVDNTDERSITEALVSGRKLLLEYERFFKEVLEGYDNMELVTTGSLLGIRETRRIMGDYVLCLEDFKNRAVFDDEIGRYTYPVDIHAAKPDAGAFKTFEEEMKAFRHQPGENYGIPYRTLTPKQLDNVLVAGRCVSSDRYIQGSIRVMPGCFITGQAAGLAAALAAAANCGTREIAVSELQGKLKTMGGFLPNC